MTSERLTRRRYIGVLGTAVSAGTAGCSGVFGGTESNTPSNSSTTPGDQATSAGNTTTAAETQSPYTQVYRETIGSVVLLKVTTGDGRSGQGSGFVYRDNYVITNAHVVSDATDVQARFSQGEWRSTSVVGVDPSSDLAVVEVENPPDYAKALSLVDAQPAIGTEVVAIGNPFGLEGSVTSGLVSGVNRSIPAPNDYTIPDAIQTGAPVNPGNSGGPLVNLEGQVVGVINSGGGDNLAFAISAALVKRVVPSLIEDGEYTHPYMGAQFRTVTPRIAEQSGLDQPRGVIVGDVDPDGPSAGVLQSGDVILSIGGKQVDNRQQLTSYLALKASPGDTVQVTLLRNGERRTVEVTLGERPDQPSAGR